jgi:hypothetical protein
MTDTPALPTREEIIAQNAAARAHSVMMYDINITNYEMAIAQLDATPDLAPDMVEYRARLTELLASERRERNKEALILSVLEVQLPAV